MQTIVPSVNTDNSVSFKKYSFFINSLLRLDKLVRMSLLIRIRVVKDVARIMVHICIVITQDREADCLKFDVVSIMLLKAM